MVSYIREIGRTMKKMVKELKPGLQVRNTLESIKMIYLMGMENTFILVVLFMMVCLKMGNIMVKVFIKMKKMEIYMKAHGNRISDMAYSR